MINVADEAKYCQKYYGKIIQLTNSLLYFLTLFFYLLNLIKQIRSLNFDICYDLQNSSRTEFYRKNFKIKNWSSSRTVLKKDESKKQFDEKGVIERFNIQLERSNITKTDHVLYPDFSWAIDHDFNCKDSITLFMEDNILMKNCDFDNRQLLNIIQPLLVWFK